MTREEAIEAIKCNWPDSRYTILREALDMAISALRQQEQSPDSGKMMPLTLDELRKMDGEPVWVQSPGVPEYGRWAIVEGVGENCLGGVSMERLSDTAIEIINELHTERLDYSSEYIPLIDAANRLSAYEDSGLEPEDVRRLQKDWTSLIITIDEMGCMPHLRELYEAEKEGQLVVLPCKVGDSIYIPDLEKKIPVKVRVQGISISVSGRTILHFGGYPVECAWGDGCGKDWFLTREEAEAALALKGGEGL